MAKQKHNYNHLYYFWMVANSGSIKNASEALFVSPSTLCDQVKVLEQRFNTALFTKEGKGLKLTEKGYSLYQLVDSFFLSFPTEAELLFSFDKLKKTIVVGVSPSISTPLVSEIIKAMIEKDNYYPVIHYYNHEELYQKTINQKVDVIISEDDIFPENSNLKFQKHKLRKFCVVSKSKNINPKYNSFPKKLDRVPFISYGAGHYLHQKLIEFFLKNKIKPKISCELDNIDLMVNLTLEGVGVSILPYLAVKEHINEGTLFLHGELNNFSPYLFIGLSKKSFDLGFIEHAFNVIRKLQLS